MTTSQPFASLRGCLALSVLLLLGAVSASSASTGKEFVNLRKQKHFDQKLTYAQVQSDPAAHIGNVLELKGTIGGKIASEDTLTIMLNLPDKDGPTLDIPLAEAALVREFPSPTLRILVQVGEKKTGSNVVQLKVLAVATDGQVKQIEADETARAATSQQEANRKKQEEARWKQEAERSVRKHGTGDTTTLQSFTPGDMNSMASQLSTRAQPLFGTYFDFIAKWNPKLDRKAVGTITFHLLNFSDRYEVDPRLVVSMIIAESDFDPNCTSHSGAMGLGQLMPETARDLGINNPYDPGQNLGGSIAYLRSRLDKFADKSQPGGGMSFEQVSLAMAAYNAGENAVKKYNGVPPYRETQAYVKKVINLYKQLCAK